MAFDRQASGNSDGRPMNFILPVRSDRAPYKCASFLFIYEHSHNSTQYVMSTIKILMTQFAGYNKWFLLKVPSETDLLLLGAHIHLVTLFDGTLLETALTPTACQFFFLFEMASWVMARHYVWAKGLCSMSKRAVWSTGNDEVTLRARRRRNVLDKSPAANFPRHFCGCGLLENRWRCHSYLFVTHENTTMWLTGWLLGMDSSSRAGQTTECETVRRAISVSLLRVSSRCPQHQTLQSSFLLTDPPEKETVWAPSSWNFRTMRNTLLLLKPYRV